MEDNETIIAGWREMNQRNIDTSRKKRSELELCELSRSTRKHLVDRITCVMRDEFGVNDTNIDKFWDMFIIGQQMYTMA